MQKIFRLFFFPFRILFKSPGCPYYYFRRWVLTLKTGRSSFTPNLGSNKLLDALIRQGFAKLPDDFLESRIIKEMHDFVLQTNSNHSPSSNGKIFWQKLFSKETTLDSPLLKISLEDKLISTVKSYLRCDPWIVSIEVIRSYFNTLQNVFSASQLWHKDYDDSRMLKLFIYLSDVDSIEDGPFTFIPADISSKIFVPWFKPRISDKAIEKRIGDQNVIRVFGKKYTCFLIDTHRCVHMGSRVLKDHSRLAYVATFISKNPIWPDYKPILPNSDFIPMKVRNLVFKDKVPVNFLQTNFI